MCELLNRDRLQSLWNNTELWSTLGFEGLSIAFDVPVTGLRKLSEKQKQGLMKLLHRLTTPLGEELRTKLDGVSRLKPEERFAILKELSSAFQK